MDEHPSGLGANGVIIKRIIYIAPDISYPASTALALHEEIYHAHQPAMMGIDMETEAKAATALWAQDSGLMPLARKDDDWERLDNYLSIRATSGEEIARTELRKTLVGYQGWNTMKSAGVLYGGK